MSGARRTARLLSHLAPQSCASNNADDDDMPDGMPDDYEPPAMKYRPRYWTAEEIEALRVRSPPAGEPEHLIVVSGKVYDVTEFLIDHPGGGDVITELEGAYASEEMTEAFEEAEHSDEAMDDLFNYYVGVLVDADTGEPVVPGLQLETGPLGPAPELNGFDTDAGDIASGAAGAGPPAVGARPLPGGGLQGEDEPGGEGFDDDDAVDDEGAVDDPAARAAPQSTTRSVPVSSNAPSAFPEGPMRHTVLTLLERRQLSADTLRLRFALPSPCQRLGLPTGKHLQFMAKIAGGAETAAGLDDVDGGSGSQASSLAATVVRSYTPVSLASAVGHVELVIKVYHSLAAVPPHSRLGDPSFPLGGVMSQYLSSLRPGDGVRVRGPRGRLSYGGEGQFRVRARKVPLLDSASGVNGAGADAGEQVLHARRIGMIAGGTGIAPMLQLLRAELEAAGLPLDPVRDSNGNLEPARAADNSAVAGAQAEPLESGLTFSLLFANRRVDDILCRHELEHAASALNGAAAKDDTVPSLRVCYTVDSLDGLSTTERHRWEHEQRYGVGYITKEMLEHTMPPPGPDTLILLCGPKPMVRHACLPALAALGYNRARCFVY